ncbi:MAG: methyltransferase domain-containing protein [Candidatus Bathyarchaeota archaeon]|nr:methyltransferase domain-containing protein [Candidatus Bathyarchaeota archaeon]
MDSLQYIHGYSSTEFRRLQDQAQTLTTLLHHDTLYPPQTRVLEAGCGIGAQTLILAKNNPQTQIVSLDISSESIKTARASIDEVGYSNVSFLHGDLFSLPIKDEAFDHIFVCFVLEHLPNPKKALDCLKSVLKTGGSLTVIEGDHGSAYFHPDSQAAKKTIQCLIDLQAQTGGNALIGRQLYPLLSSARYRNIHVSPRMVYADASFPKMVEGFTKNTFNAMIEGVKEQAISAKMIKEKEWEDGIRDLYRTREKDGVFCYTFFKAIGIK